MRDRWRTNLGGVDIATPVSQMYGRSRFDDLSDGMRRRFGERLHGRSDTQRKKPTRVAGYPVVEFTAAAHEYMEPAFDVTVTPTTSAQDIGPFDIPAQGYLRSIFLLVTTSGGAIGTPVTHEDYPFRILSNIALEEPNGAVLYGAPDGFDLFLANLYGNPGGFLMPDPRSDPDYSAAANGISATFGLRVPVEIFANNGWGSIANQNAAGAFKFRASIRTIADIWPTAPTAAPSVRVRGYVEAWTQPTPTDLAGRPQAVMPPMHGTTQYWSRRFVDVSSGSDQIELTRVGNLIRKVIFVVRTSGVRTTANFPDDATLRWDGRNVALNEPRYIRRSKMARWFEHASAGVPAGVFVYDYDHDMIPGNGTPELFLPTVQSTRLELSGSFGAASTVEVLTNDIAPVEVVQEERYMERNASGGVGPLSERA